MIPRREHKKRPGKAHEQRLRHVAYQRFYDAHKALQEGATEVTVEAFGVEYTLVPYEGDFSGMLITRLNKGVVMSWSYDFDYDGVWNSQRIHNAWYLTTKSPTKTPWSIQEKMILGTIKSIRFLHDIPEGSFTEACAPYLVSP